VGIPYKGNVPGLNALLAGEVHVLFPTAGSGGPYVKSGRLRGLAVTSAQPSALFPDLPTVAATGLPGYESITILGVLVRANTPATVIKVLQPEIVRFITRPDVKEKFFNTGAEVVGSSPEEFARQIKNEMTVLGKVIKDVGIRADE
jgi:tripartite-type tricarboxylate transporter receptor subunit TctC